MEAIRKIEILIVEDNPDFIHFIKKILSNNSYHISSIQSGTDAYHYLLNPKVKPEIVILDYQLPGLNGLEILEKLSTHDHDYGFIFLTVNDNIENVVKAMAAGALDFIVKSNKLGNELPEKIEKVYRIHRSLIEKKQHEIEANQAKELYPKIFEEFPALVWRSRVDKTCDYFNKTWLEFTGRTMEQEIGNGRTEGVHPDDLDNCVQTYISAFDKHEAFVMDYRLKNKHGEYRWIRDYGRPFYDLDDTFSGYIGSCYDVTNSKNNELRLVELNATKNMLFSIIAHDLRSPISSLLNLLQLLHKKINKYDKAEIAEYILAGNKVTQETFNLLEDLLLWSQSQSDKLTFQPKKIALAEICNEIIESKKESAEAKEIEIKCIDIDKTEIYADLNMIKTVLRNLISNAIKFTGRNGQINIYTETNKEEVTVIISDNGIGISQENTPKLWDLSQKFTERGTEDEKGTGFGLTLCAEFVKKHGGSIWVESELGKGSDFKFTIPI